MDRATRCYLGWAVMETRTEDALQALVDGAPQASTCYSDGFALYANLVYGEATYTAVLDKSQTYTVEGGTPTCGIIWPASGGNRAVSRTASGPYAGPSSSSSGPTISVSCGGSGTPRTRNTSLNLYHQLVSHSLFTEQHDCLLLNRKAKERERSRGIVTVVAELGRSARLSSVSGASWL